MKKNILALLLASAALISCGQAEGPSSSDSAQPDSSSLVPETIYWSEGMDALLKETIGEEGLKALPVFEADAYSGNNNVDSSSLIPYTTIYCKKNEVSGNEAKTYAVVLTASGFSSQSTSTGYIRYKEITDTAALVVSFVQGDSKNGYALGVSIYLSYFRYTSWPETLIEHYTGLTELPHLEGTYYYIQYNSDGSLYINIEGLSSSCITEYTSLLESKGYTISYYYYSVVVYSAIDANNTHTISYYYDTDSSMMALSVSLNS